MRAKSLVYSNSCVYINGMKQRTWLSFLCAVIVFAAKGQGSDSTYFIQDSNTIAASQVWQHLRVLSHDSMMGRRPGTEGEMKTIRYLAAAFQKAGLKPGYGKSFLQPVKLVEASSSGKLFLRANNRSFNVADSHVIIRAYNIENIGLSDAPIVFAGYGIDAPEFDWNDYKNINVRDKIVMVLEGEPPVFKERRDTTLKNSHHSFLFAKHQYARERGAAGIIILCSYPSFYDSEKWALQDAFISQQEKLKGDRLKFFGWLCEDAILPALSLTRLPLATLKQLANDSAFFPFNIPVSFDLELRTELKPFTSHNVVGVIKGSDPVLKKECIVYSTHWDGFGVGLPQNGDSIYNGAKDNAGGISEMLAIAKAMSSMRTPLRRSVVFIASTAEEHGELGAEAYANRPLFAMNKTVLAIGMDIFSPWGKPVKLQNASYGYTDVDDLLQQLADKRNLSYQGPKFFSMLAASDQYQFMLKGVPVVFASMNAESYGLSESQVDSIENRSAPHTPFDEICESWDLRSAAAEAQLLFELGVMVANANERPKWKMKVRRAQ
jgi:Peptidase family M28